MALTAPLGLSIFHNAIRPRGVYLSGPGKVFAIWTVYDVGGIRFVAKQHDGAVGSEFMLPVAPDVVFDFGVAALTGDRAVVAYGDGARIKYFVYDFATDNLVVDTTIMAQGHGPALSNDGRVRTTFVRDNIIKLISNIPGGAETDLVSSPAYVIQSHDTGTKQPYVLYYLAGHSGDVSVALPIRDDVDSVFVYDCRDTIISGAPDHYVDKSGGGNTLDVHAGATDTDRGLRFGRAADVRITGWPVPAFFLTLESLFIPAGQVRRGRMLDGDLFMGHDAWGRAYWGYVDGGTIHVYQQTRLTGVVKGRLNHVAVTHQWGVAASTELFVNGLLVPGAWVQGTGATDPALGAITSTVDMGVDDLLVQLSANSVIKSGADIADYAKGRL